MAEKIASEEYPSASEVFRLALELLEERYRLIKLRRDVSLGVEQLDQGRGKRFDTRTLKRIRGAQLASGLQPSHPEPPVFRAWESFDWDAGACGCCLAKSHGGFHAGFHPPRRDGGVFFGTVVERAGRGLWLSIAARRMRLMRVW